MRLAGANSRARAELNSLDPRYYWSYLLGEEYGPGIYPATEMEAMALPPFGRGVSLLANAVAGTAWHAERFDSELGVPVRLADQPSVVVDPNPETTQWNYKWSATEDGILYGNHFALMGDMDFRTLRPGWLIPLAADAVWVLQDPETGAWSWVVGGEEFGRDEIFHVSFGNRSGEILGRGVLRQYAESLGGYVAAETHAANYFAGGTLPPAVLQSPTVVQQEQADELKAKWRELTATREPVVLPMGYMLTPIVSNAEQAQLVESRNWNAELVAMILGIPPWKLGLQGPSMTYANVETADIDFIRDSVDKYGHALAETFSKYLMPRGTEVVFEYASRMRADQTTTAAVLKTYVDAGIMTRDEARAARGLPPLAESTDEGETPEGIPETTPEELQP
jgi:HK97 family phage portal protein